MVPLLARVLAPALLAAACAEPTAPPAAAGAAPAPRRPSILFLSMDTLGAEHTSLHGYARRTTPHLEAIAGESVVFERCRTNAPYTRASYVSQFSGLLPSCSSVDREEFRQKHGRKPRNWEVFRIPEGRQTLTELLRGAGYRTAAFVDNPNASPAIGLAQGFEHYDTSAASISSADGEGGIRAIVPLLLDWIDRLPRDEPFFVFVNAIDVHKPYLPPADFRDTYAADPHGEPDAEFAVGRGGFGVIDLAHVEDYFGKPPYPERMRTAPLVARYDEEVRMVDEACGRLFAALRERGRFDELLLVFSADHGEAMGQPDYKFGHGTHVEQVLHVPLLFRLPGGAKGGQRIPAPVQLLDLYPTMAELLALPAPEGLQGRSLVPLMDGQHLEERSFVHETGRLASTSVTEGEWRLVVSFPGRKIHCVLGARGRAWLAEHHPELGGDFFAVHGIDGALRKDPRAAQAMAEAREALMGPFFELYHLPSDPHLARDLSAERPELVERLRGRLRSAQELSALERKRLPVVPEALAPPAELDELRRLGYVGEDGEDED